MKLRKERIAYFAIIYSLVLLVIKVTITILSKSLTVASETIDVVIDIILILILNYAIKKSKQPPDLEHTFGHGKHESLASIIQCVLIVIIYVLFIYNAIHSIVENIVNVESTLFAFIGFTIFVISNIMMGIYMISRGKKTKSESIIMQGYNYFFDGLRNVIVIVALLLYFFDWKLADPVFAIIISIIVIVVTFITSRNAFENLLERNPRSGEQMIELYKIPYELEDVVGIQEIRVRKVGNTVFITMIINMEDHHSLNYAHEITEGIETKIKQLFPEINFDILIHVHCAKK
ncbi:MAG: cation diffusion facilitator family transporter [Candidatus Hodarchaeota archaeon]